MAFIDDLRGVRERWHTKQHPFFAAFGEGKLPLRALGTYLALHYKFVEFALAGFGLVYARARGHDDIRKGMAENIAEEEGFKAIPREGHRPHDHNELIMRFCAAAGLSEAEVRATKMTPAWWARSLYHHHTALYEPLGVILAMQFTQEGQQPALNTEIVLPALARHHGYPAGAPEIEFFTEHAAADVEHSQRQAALCVKHLDTEALRTRALEVAEQCCTLRWASITDLYRRDHLGEKDVLPPGIR